MKSYLRTLVIALVMGAVMAIVASFSDHIAQGVVSSLVFLAASVCFAGLMFIATSVIVVLARDAHQRRTHSNLFERANVRRNETTLASGVLDLGLRLRRMARSLVAPGRLVVGDVVEVLSYDEILRTLDSDGCLASLPFMPEMQRYCGTRAVVFRSVDKIYDYGGTKKLRRLDDTYLLIGLRCDGSAHAGCEAACYVLWKKSWLKRVNDFHPEPELGAPNGGALREADSGLRRVEVAGQAGRYRCQFTELVSASVPMSPRDYRQDLRPLLAGNVTLGAFCLAMATRLFNFVQGLRGGVSYPSLPEGGVSARSEGVEIRSGDVVRVRSTAEIAATLDRARRNRGLYFDPEMTKYCGQMCTVTGRVNRIIDDATGLVRIMKSPCYVLRGVDYTGETLRFVAQHEHLYWRDLWLVRENTDDLDAETG